MVNILLFVLIVIVLFIVRNVSWLLRSVIVVALTVYMLGVPMALDVLKAGDLPGKTSKSWKIGFDSRRNAGAVIWVFGYPALIIAGAW